MKKITFVIFALLLIKNLPATEQEGVLTSSTDLGIWERAEIPFDSINCHDVILHNDTLYAGVQKYGMLYSTDDGAKWEILSNSLIENHSSSPRHLYKNDKVFGSILSGGIDCIISTDGGINWKTSDIGIYTPQNPPLNDGIVFEDKFILATDVGLKYTTNLGEYWYDFYGGDLDSGEHASRIMLDEKNNLYLSTSKGLLLSEDKGINWDILINEKDIIENGIIYYLSINKNIIYGLNNNHNIEMTLDQGETWEIVSEDLMNYNAPHKIVKIGNKLIVLVGGGLLISATDGKDWEEYLLPFNKPNGNPYIFNNYIIKGNYIIAATEMGLLRAKLTDIGITPTSVETQRNYLYTLPPYPLPSQNEVKVQFYWDINLPMTADDISVYDITGRKLITKDKIRLEKQADHYGNLIWDCSGEKSGIYLINIKHGTEERSVKVVVE